MQYAATQPDGLVSLIVESSPPSVPAWMGELAKLRAELPPEVEATLRKHEEAGTFTDPEYEEAVMVFYKRHLCRTDPWPDWLVECFAILEANPEVYHSMNGPSEFHVIGTLQDWDITPQLGQDPGADAALLRPLRRGHAGERRGRAPGDPGLRVRRAWRRALTWRRPRSPRRRSSSSAASSAGGGMRKAARGRPLSCKQTKEPRRRARGRPRGLPQPPRPGPASSAAARGSAPRSCPRPSAGRARSVWGRGPARGRRPYGRHS